MACYSPLQAYRTPSGDVVFHDKGYEPFSLACGQCVGCRLERSRQWAMRCVHEASLHSRNCFITLTYDDAHLPSDGGLHYSDFQLFMKRLRKMFRGQTIRFFMCGEYGETFGRPHFHACLFGHDFSDKQFWKRTGSSSCLYRSAALERLWPFGFSSVGDVNFESAAYVARYVMKKITGDAAKVAYASTDSETGEVTWVEPEFCHMSLKPGIGARWLERYSEDVYPHDYCVIRGKKVRPPKYYDRVFGRDNELDLLEIKAGREFTGYELRADSTDARLAVKAQVAKARLSLFSRSVE